MKVWYLSRGKLYGILGTLGYLVKFKYLVALSNKIQCNHFQG